MLVSLQRIRADGLHVVDALAFFGYSEGRSSNFRIPPPFFAAFNEGAAKLYNADLTFCPLLSVDIATIVSLAKYLKRKEGVEVLIIDALHESNLTQAGLPARPNSAGSRR